MCPRQRIDGLLPNVVQRHVNLQCESGGGIGGAGVKNENGSGG